MIAWRICKARFDPWDATGATLWPGRWHSRGRPVLYAADCFAGAVLEVLVHASRPRQFMGAHHSVRLEIPESLVEIVGDLQVPEWDQADPIASRLFGDQWLAEARTAALVVPALPSRPIGRVVVINPAHPDAARIGRGEPFRVPWDERLF